MTAPKKHSVQVGCGERSEPHQARIDRERFGSPASRGIYKNGFPRAEKSGTCWHLTDSGSRIAVLLCILLFVFVVINNAWVADDAYITFRTVSNFISGYGLTWNTSERVQAFTNPLWMLMMSAVYFVTRDVYYSSIILSILFSVLTIWVLAFRIAIPPYGAILAVAVLAASKAFTEYSTSGLENSLTHLLLALFCLRFLCRDATPKELFYLSLIASFATVNRLDNFLIFLPALALACWICFRSELPCSTAALAKSVILGSSPLILWELFAIVYYGFPFPNTAYAKLFSGADAQQHWKQGFYYLLDSLERDPITLIVIFAGIVLAIARRNAKSIAIAIGALIYLIYIVRIGGDFMSGRFLTTPLLGCVVVLSLWPMDRRRFAQLLIPVLIIGFAYPPLAQLAILHNRDWDLSKQGVVDECSSQYEATGMLRENHFCQPPTGSRVEDGNQLRLLAETEPVVCVRSGIGLTGYYAGPKAFIVDCVGLADAFLARLPATAPPPAYTDKKQNWRWRIGHPVRAIPDGYIETVKFNKVLIKDKRYAEFYEKLSRIIKGNIFECDRFREIWNMNMGKYDHLLRR